MLIFFSQTIIQLRESLWANFNSVQSGGISIVFKLPNGEKLTHKFGITSPSKVRNMISTFDEIYGHGHTLENWYTTFQLEFYCSMHRIFITLSPMQVLYEFVFCVGMIRQYFGIFSVLPRSLIPSSASKTILDYQLTQPSTLLVENEEGDIIKLFEVRLLAWLNGALLIN